MLVEGKNVLVTGGTGSLGQAVVRRLLTGELGMPARIVVISRDEAKQHDMRLSYLRRREATDDVIYRNSRQLLRFIVGDVRDYPSLVRAVRDAHLVINAAALKQVPTCEYFPFEAIQTNLHGAQNLVRAIRENRTPVETVVGISTDKACKPINVMGMTKAIMERILIEGNIGCETRFACVRYGNVIASRGSVVPLFKEQIATGGPVTVTMKEMTRFLLTLDQAVDTVMAAVRSARAGETYVPKVPAARVEELADIMIEMSRASSKNRRTIEKVFTGIRPGEKVHEIMVSDEECYRTTTRDGYYVIRPMLPELAGEPAPPAPSGLSGEYSSSVITADTATLQALLRPYMEPTRDSAGSLA